MNKDKDQNTESLEEDQKAKKKKLYSINASDGITSLYKKPKLTDTNIKNKDIDLEVKQDQHAAFARYRELVKARKEREKLHPRKPEVYHHNIYKNK